MKNVIITILIAVGTYTPVAAQNMELKGLDHIGISVPDMDSALFFFTQIMGFEAVTKTGPFQLDDAWKKKYHIRKDATVEKMEMLRAGNGANIELFQYKSPRRNLKMPFGDDIGWYHLAFYTDDIYKSVSYLKSKGISVLSDPILTTTGDNAGETWVYFTTPWGLQIELVCYPDGKAYEKNNPKVVLWTPRENKNANQETKMDSKEIETLAKKHLAIWSERNVGKRSISIQEVYADDIDIIDPNFVINGHLKLNDFIAELQNKYPDYLFTIAKPVDSHHNIARLFWQFGPVSKPDEITGQDVFVIENSKIRSLYIFIDKLKNNQ